DLAAALIHRPSIVYLDEPTIGLDIAVKDRVRAFLRQLCAEGTTLILTTHDLGDIEDVCERIVIIDGGRIIYDGGITEVTDRFARHRELYLHFAVPPGQDGVRLADVAARLPEAEVAQGSTTGEHIELTVRFDRSALTAGQIVTRLLPLGEVVDFRINEPAIEDVIRRVYAGELLIGDPA